jgi:hypothetical protein
MVADGATAGAWIARSAIWVGVGADRVGAAVGPVKVLALPGAAPSWLLSTTTMRVGADFGPHRAARYVPTALDTAPADRISAARREGVATDGVSVAVVSGRWVPV